MTTTRATARWSVVGLCNHPGYPTAEIMKVRMHSIPPVPQDALSWMTMAHATLDVARAMMTLTEHKLVGEEKDKAVKLIAALGELPLDVQLALASLIYMNVADAVRDRASEIHRPADGAGQDFNVG